MARMIDADRLPVKSWKKTAVAFQDDYTAGAGTDWTLQVATAENRMLWEIIGAIENAPTLTTPNEFAARTLELDELYTKIQAITGFTVEQLLDMFLAGYTLEPPDYSTNFKELASIAENTPPNEPLTLEQLHDMVGDPVYDYLGQEWYVIEDYYDHELRMTDGTTFEDGDELDRVEERFYRRPPEGEEDT